MAETKTRTLGLVCPACLNQDETVKLDLGDLDSIECTGCGETFSAADAVNRFVALAERWKKVGRWLAEAPLAE